MVGAGEREGEGETEGEGDSEKEGEGEGAAVAQGMDGAGSTTWTLTVSAGTRWTGCWSWTALRLAWQARPTRRSGRRPELRASRCRRPSTNDRGRRARALVASSTSERRVVGGLKTTSSWSRDQREDEEAEEAEADSESDDET
jgi:hypothetical protein